MSGPQFGDKAGPGVQMQVPFYVFQDAPDRLSLGPDLIDAPGEVENWADSSNGVRPNGVRHPCPLMELLRVDYLPTGVSATECPLSHFGLQLLTPHEFDLATCADHVYRKSRYEDQHLL